MAYNKKESDNTPLEEIGTIPNDDAPNINPNAKTLIDRYVFASNWCKDKRVLDCASGVGYGAHILRALGATEIEAVDIDKDTIDYAENFYSDDKILFETLDITKPLNKDVLNNDSFDVVVSMETFEHVKREDVPQMLNNFKQLTKEDGKIIISTPQRHTPEFVYQGGTHLYEYTLNEFVQEISEYFETFDIYYAIEFRHPASNELNTVFTKDTKWADNAPVMVAVITNAD